MESDGAASRAIRRGSRGPRGTRVDLDDLLHALSDDELAAALRGSADDARTKAQGLRRNVEIALENAEAASKADRQRR